jgi:hypothetical protein
MSPGGRKNRRKPARQPRTISSRVDKELARTWLLTVINPILDGLRREKVWLARRNWTWRAANNSFEQLWPAATYVEARYQDNVEPFLSEYRTAARSLSEHDQLVKGLADACQAAFRILLGSAVFQAAEAEATNAALEAGIVVDEARGAVPAEQWSRLLAEYVVNGVQSLPSHYSTARFWAVAGPTLLATTHHPQLHAEFNNVGETGQKLLEAVDRCLSAFNGIRAEYTRRFALAPVPLLGSVDL